mgnify:CR=1 FL=1
MKLCIYGRGNDGAMYLWELNGCSYVFMGVEWMKLCIYGRGNDGAMYLWERKGWSCYVVMGEEGMELCIYGCNC